MPGAHPHQPQPAVHMQVCYFYLFLLSPYHGQFGKTELNLILVFQYPMGLVFQYPMGLVFQYPMGLVLVRKF